MYAADYLNNPPLTSREKRLVGLLRVIASTPLEGEPCDDAPNGVQVWDEAVYATWLVDMVLRARAILAEIDGKESSRCR